MLKIRHACARCGVIVLGWLQGAQAPAALLARLYVAQVFFLSGLTKLRDWDITLALFLSLIHI